MELKEGDEITVTLKGVVDHKEMDKNGGFRWWVYLPHGLDSYGQADAFVLLKENGEVETYS